MELRHLRYFVAVAEELNFRRAAERLHVSRPALSKQVKELEGEIGVRLLDRDTVRVELTPAGLILLGDARRILADTEDAIRRCAQAQEGYRGTLKLGTVGSIASEFLPQAIKSFRLRCPEVEIVFVEVPPPEQAQALMRGIIDIAFDYTLNGSTDAKLQSLCVIRSNFGVAVSSHHPWASRESIELTDFDGGKLLSIGSHQKSAHRENLIRLWADEGLNMPPLKMVESFDTFLNLIAADQGVSLLPEVLDLRTHGITIRPLSMSQASRDFRMWVLWKKDMATSSVAPFVEVLREMFPI